MKLFLLFSNVLFSLSLSSFSINSFSSQLEFHIHKIENKLRFCITTSFWNGRNRRRTKRRRRWRWRRSMRFHGRGFVAMQTTRSRLRWLEWDREEAESFFVVAEEAEGFRDEAGGASENRMKSLVFRGILPVRFLFFTLILNFD